MDLSLAVVRFALTFVRFMTCFALLPLFNMRNVPIQVKSGLAALCALLIMPPLDEVAAVESWPVLLQLAIHEVIVGMLLVFVPILVFAIVQFAGQLTDVPMGFGMASIFDPATGTQMPIFTQFYHLFATLIFFGLDAHMWVIHALTQSYEFIPFNGIIDMEITFTTILELSRQMFIVGLKISLPVIGAVLLTDLGLGIVIRAVPQINVFVLGFPIKILIGMAVVLLALPFYVAIVSELFAYDGLMFSSMRSILLAGGN